MKYLAVYLFLSLSTLLAQTSAFEILPPHEREVLNRSFRERIAGYQLREGNGDIIGNGSGLMELNFAYVYRNIPSFIGRFLNSTSFNLGKNDRKALLAIKKVVETRQTYANVFEYVEEQDLHILFPQEENRIALTGFSPEFPIYINKTLAYQTPGLEQDLPMLASIVIHELGHQVGIRSHKYLDYLGAAVQNYLQSRFSSHSIEMSGELSVKIFNRILDDYATPQIFISYGNNSVDATNTLRTAVVCPNGRQALTYDIRNAHWERPETRTSARFNFWSKLICPYRGTTRSYERDYSIRIHLPSLEVEIHDLILGPDQE